MKKTISAFLFSFSCLLIFAQSVVKEQIYFDSGSSSVKAAESQKIFIPAEVTAIILTAHTDSDGSQNYNLGLSKMRLNAVHAILLGMGLDRNLFTLKSHGENQPAVPNTNDYNMSLNRRVEIAFLVADQLATSKPAGIKGRQNLFNNPNPPAPLQEDNLAMTEAQSRTSRQSTVRSPDSDSSNRERVEQPKTHSSVIAAEERRSSRTETRSAFDPKSDPIPDLAHKRTSAADTEAPKVTAKKELQECSSTGNNKNGLSNFISFAAVQQFREQPYDDIYVVTDAGAEIYFPANSFATHASEVLIEIEEYLAYEDMVLAGLNTVTTDGSHLISAAMFNIKAIADGKMVQLKPGASAYLNLPETQSADYKLFIGELDNGNIEWALDQATAPAKKNSLAARDDYKLKKVKAIEGPYKVDIKTSVPEHRRLNEKSAEKLQDYANTILNKVNSDPDFLADASLFNQLQFRIILSPNNYVRTVQMLKSNDAIRKSFRKIAPEAINGFPAIWIDQEKGEKYVDVRVYKDISFKTYEVDRSAVGKEIDSNTASLVDASEYAYSFAKLDWINIDKFLRSTKPKTNILVKAEEHEQVRLVFSGRQSIISGNTHRYGEMVFRGIPVREQVTIIGIKQVDGQIYFAKQSFETGTRDNIKLDYVPFTTAAIQEVIRSI